MADHERALLVGQHMAQQAVTGCVKRPAVNLLAVSADESFCTRQHFLRGAASERKQEYAFGFYAAIDQVRDSIDKCTSFSSAGTRDNKQRTIAMCCRRGLLRIEISAEIAGRRWD